MAAAKRELNGTAPRAPPSSVEARVVVGSLTPWSRLTAEEARVRGQAESHARAKERTARVRQAVQMSTGQLEVEALRMELATLKEAEATREKEAAAAAKVRPIGPRAPTSIRQTTRRLQTTRETADLQTSAPIAHHHPHHHPHHHAAAGAQ